MVTQPVRKKGEENLTPNINFIRTLRKLEQDAEILKRIRKLTNECLTNCAYHDKNMETQVCKMKMAHAPDNEIEFIQKLYGIKQRKANLLFNGLQKLVKDWDNK